MSWVLPGEHPVFVSRTRLLLTKIAGQTKLGVPVNEEMFQFRIPVGWQHLRVCV